MDLEASAGRFSQAQSTLCYQEVASRGRWLDRLERLGGARLSPLSTTHLCDPFSMDWAWLGRVKSFGGRRADYGAGLAADSSGNAYVVVSQLVDLIHEADPIPKPDVQALS